MNFDTVRDFHIFDTLIQKRPEIDIELLKKDLEDYYLPYIQKLVDQKAEISPNKGLIVGVSAVQGAGKTTQGEILEILLKHLGHNSVSQSIDDHYLTHLELCELRDEDPRYIRRGVTHDISLAIRDLQNLQDMQSDDVILVSGYDKGANSGDGERFRWINIVSDLVVEAQIVEKKLMVNKERILVKAIELKNAKFKNTDVFLPSNMGSDVAIIEPNFPQSLVNFLKDQVSVRIFLKDEKIVFQGSEEMGVDLKDVPHGWHLVSQKPDFIFYDGWMVGARSVEDESIFETSLPALDTPEHIQFAKDVNTKLLKYLPLWEMVQFLNLLYVEDYKISLKWRDQAEEHLRKKGEGMTSEQIQEFVYYFWRSVHPAIHIKNLAHDVKNTQQVVVINDDHTISEILMPSQVIKKYP